MVLWCSGYHDCLSRSRPWVRVPSEPPFGFIAQLVEHKTENLGVAGSIPAGATIVRNIPCISRFLFCNNEYIEKNLVSLDRIYIDKEDKNDE